MSNPDLAEMLANLAIYAKRPRESLHPAIQQMLAQLEAGSMSSTPPFQAPDCTPPAEQAWLMARKFGPGGYVTAHHPDEPWGVCIDETGSLVLWGNAGSGVKVPPSVLAELVTDAIARRVLMITAPRKRPASEIAK